MVGEFDSLYKLDLELISGMLWWYLIETICIWYRWDDRSIKEGQMMNMEDRNPKKKSIVVTLEPYDMPWLSFWELSYVRETRGWFGCKPL